MSTGTYMYAGTRAKTLERMQLSLNQVELLTGAQDVEELHKVLYDTYLALFLSKQHDVSVEAALDDSLIEARKTLELIAPDAAVLAVLWIEYDFHNLKTILKGKKANRSEEDILSNCYSIGTISPKEMLRRYNDGRLGGYNTHLEQARIEGEVREESFGLDLVFGKHYFKQLGELAKEINDSFVTRYVTLLIDTFNIKAALRIPSLENVSFTDVYAPGGSFSRNDFETKERTLEILSTLGGDRVWSDAIAHLQETGSSSHIEKSIDDYITRFLREESISIFTPAALFSFFHSRKNNAQIIRTMLAAKESGMAEQDLRVTLRQLHV